MSEDQVGIQRVVPPTSPDASREVIRRSLAALRSHLGIEVAYCGVREADTPWIEYVDATGALSTRRLPGHEDTRAATLLLDHRLTTEEVRERRSLGPVTPPLGWVYVPLVRGDGVRLGSLCCSRRQSNELGLSDLTVLRLFAEMMAGHVELVIDHERRVRDTRVQVMALISSGGPVMALQPIVGVEDREVHSYEALARFDDPATTEHYFAAAFDVGLGPALESAAVRSAATLLPRLPAGTRLSVNVSAESLVLDDILDVLAGPEADRLIVELTEHTRVEAYPALTQRLALMRQAGALLAVDDAGSGYAGLEHILRLQPDIVKLDRVLVQGIADHAGRQAVAEAMVGFVRRLDALLVAEGVEDERDLAMLAELGVDLAQGYLVGEPELQDTA